MKYRIHYANGKHENVVTDETREQLLAQCKPIVDVVQLEEDDAGKKQAAIQADGGSGEQSAASQAEGNSASGGEGVSVENKKRKTTSKKGQA